MGDGRALCSMLTLAPLSHSSLRASFDSLKQRKCSLPLSKGQSLWGTPMPSPDRVAGFFWGSAMRLGEGLRFG